MPNTPIPKTAIVIGGGIAGCATAHALAQKNINVTLIERHEALAQAASGNPLAVLYPRLTGQNTALEALNQAGYQTTLALLRHLGHAVCQYHPVGVVQLAMNHQLAKQQQQAVLAYQASALKINAASAAELSSIAGVTLAHEGVYLPEAGGIHLGHLCKVLTRDARIQINVKQSALSLHRAPDHAWHVLDDQHRLLASADVVVIANSHDALNFQETAHLPITTARGQLSYLPQQASININTIICGDGYITPSIAGVHYLGASFNQDDMTASLREADHASNLGLLKAMCPPLYDALHDAPMQGRVAWRSQSKDYLPLAGPLLDAHVLTTQKFYYNHEISDLPWLHGLYVNLAHGAKGFLTAPLCARLIADLITQTLQAPDHRLMNALQPNRFILRTLGLKAIAQRLISASNGL